MKARHTNGILYYILLIHAVITFAAAIVLVILPAFIPSTVNIKITSEQYLLSYFLATAEISIAYLSFVCRNIKDLSQLVSNNYFIPLLWHFK